MIDFALFILSFFGPFQSSNDTVARFEAQTIDSAIAIGYGLSIGDVDGDKKPDIILADKKQFVWYRNGDWKRFVLAEHLTESDNVCITAKDLDGDGKVEIAVGAQWNPSETKDDAKSGAVFFLQRPANPTDVWKPIELYHEPTIHRMRWVEFNGKQYLAVLPLHGKNNEGGEGTPVNLLMFEYPQLMTKATPAIRLVTEMHMTHNLEPANSKNSSSPGIYVAGKEAIGFIKKGGTGNPMISSMKFPGFNGAGELRAGKLNDRQYFFATVEQMHGTSLVVYSGNNHERNVLDSSFKEGHALATSDFLGRGYDQIVAGWRVKNNEDKVGIRLYYKDPTQKDKWNVEWIDDNGMACEDIQVADLDGDGKPDIIASGRATHNVKVYWNRSNS